MLGKDAGDVSYVIRRGGILRSGTLCCCQGDESCSKESGG